MGVGGKEGVMFADLWSCSPIFHTYWGVMCFLNAQFITCLIVLMCTLVQDTPLPVPATLPQHWRNFECSVYNACSVSRDVTGKDQNPRRSCSAWEWNCSLSTAFPFQSNNNTCNSKSSNNNSSNNINNVNHNNNDEGYIVIYSIYHIAVI